MKQPRFLFTSLLIAVIIIGVTFIQGSAKESNEESESLALNLFDQNNENNAGDMFEEGKQIFRYETFGDEVFWTGKLQLHKAIAGSKHGGIGPGLTPKAALEAGLKVDVDILPAAIKRQIADGKLLDDPAATLELIKLNTVLGVVGKFDDEGNLTSIGLTCALCHSTVDDVTGIGKRLDGWPNRDLNVGAIILMAPDLSAFTELLGVDEATVRKVLTAWGPGKFDAILNLDGKGFRPDGKSAATLIPEAFGHAGENLHTWTGGWGTTSYWNAYVANLEMGGQGNFYDPRLMDAKKYPIAAKAKFGDTRNSIDLVTSKLAALHFYQMAIPAPKPPDTSFDKAAASRGQILFIGKAKCGTCHVPPLFTEPGLNTHKASEICIDDFQAKRSPDETYVTQGLAGLWTHTKGGFYHDGRFPTLMDVVNHYDDCKNLALTETEKNDLIQYLMSL